MPHIDISVCIATYRRPHLLDRLLHSLANQDLGDSSISYEIIVVDNDAEKSAAETVRRFSEHHHGLPLTYDVESRKSISRARNRSVALARGRFIAFIDDDEKAAPNWLHALNTCITSYKADAVFGPVKPIYPQSCPDWCIKGGFFERPASPDGKPLTVGRTSNALVRSKWLRISSNPFNLIFGLTGGEDFDFFRRIRAQGAVLCASQYAVVHEYIEPHKTRLAWLLARSFRGGQVYSQDLVQAMDSAQRCFHYLYRGGLSVTALILAAAALPTGLHRSVWWLKKSSSYAGQVSTLLPYRYLEYDR